MITGRYIFLLDILRGRVVDISLRYRALIEHPSVKRNLRALQSPLGVNSVMFPPC